MSWMRMLAAIVPAVAIVGLVAYPAAATDPVFSVPEPGTLALLSSAAAAGIIGVRWFRNR